MAYIEAVQACHLASVSCLRKIEVDFRKARYADSKCYSVLCASEKTRGAVGLQSTKSTGIY
ncbi:hypothetical protein B5K05_17275 [Rhizobium phaseoli]|nr:hypothetical protein CO648_08510 [Rhizobium phaseoli]PDS68903.1 hypothetical protein CO651_26885 [Rhizobium phaseoli]RDJ07818.1 hypothetical protein B5K04_17240 [Rhizobium phaseoli]RDJ11092.1 hypothetical protein B5K05_17275 [Rhizobium phaseoli]